MEVCMSTALWHTHKPFHPKHLIILPFFTSQVRSDNLQIMREWIFEARVYIVYNEEEEQRVQ